MKNSAEYAKKLTKLCTSLKKSLKDAPDLVDKTIAREPANILVLACISEFTSVDNSHLILARLRSGFVDFNELRVSRPREIARSFGKGYPDVDIVIGRIISILNSVFDKYDGLDMAGIDDMGKREAQAVVKELDGITPYVYSFFIMYYIEAHAFPLNDNMYEVLRREEIINPASDFDDVHGFLGRQIPAAKAREIFVQLRAYCDEQLNNSQSVSQDENQSKKAEADDKTAKKTTTKKAAKKVTKKVATDSDAENKSKKVSKKSVKKVAKKAAKKSSK